MIFLFKQQIEMNFTSLTIDCIDMINDKNYVFKITKSKTDVSSLECRESLIDYSKEYPDTEICLTPQITSYSFSISNYSSNIILTKAVELVNKKCNPSTNRYIKAIRKTLNIPRSSGQYFVALVFDDDFDC